MTSIRRSVPSNGPQFSTIKRPFYKTLNRIGLKNTIASTFFNHMLKADTEYLENRSSILNHLKALKINIVNFLFEIEIEDFIQVTKFSNISCVIFFSKFSEIVIDSLQSNVSGDSHSLFFFLSAILNCLFDSAKWVVKGPGDRLVRFVPLISLDLNKTPI